MSGLKIAALADLHLGFTAYTASILSRNAREYDVEQAWVRTIDRLIEIGPDLVTIAGDAFHNLRPSMHALLAFRDGCRRLSESGILVVVIAGNHEAAKSASTKTPILVPDDLPGVYCVSEHRTIHLDVKGLRLAVRCAPHINLSNDASADRVVPDSDADLNVLVMHAAVRSAARPDAVPYYYAGPHAPDITRIADGFDAVLLGDYHEYTQLIPGKPVFYAGSIERTSSNIWIEKAPKGFVLIDTARPGHLEFQELDTRQMFNVNLVEDLGEIPSADVINQHMADALQDDTVKDSIFRLFVPGFPRSERAGIDRKLERALKGHALHFQLDLRSDITHVDHSGSLALRAGKSLAEAARTHFKQYPFEIAAAGLALLSIEGTPADLDTFDAPSSTQQAA